MEDVVSYDLSIKAKIRFTSSYYFLKSKFKEPPFSNKQFFGAKQ